METPSVTMWFRAVGVVRSRAASLSPWILFRQRLKDRGELKLAIIAPAVFIAFLLGVSAY